MAFIAYSILRRPAEMLAQISSCVSSDQGQDGEAGWASPEASAEPILFSLGRARAQLPTMLSGFSVPSLPEAGDARDVADNIPFEHRRFSSL
jgi:hypothetical protein